MILQTPRVSAIVAVAENNVIGQQNQLPWRLPADLKHFKNITTGYPIVMGRKTYESIGKPLPNRLNIILTRDDRFQAEGCVVVSSWEEALIAAQNAKAPEIFIIGGAQIYAQLLPQVQRLYLTKIHQTFDGDTFFPALLPNEWQEISCETHDADNLNPYSYSFITLERA